MSGDIMTLTPPQMACLQSPMTYIIFMIFKKKVCSWSCIHIIIMIDYDLSLFAKHILIAQIEIMLKSIDFDFLIMKHFVHGD